MAQIKKTGKQSKTPNLSNMAEAVNTPVNEDLFIYCSSLYASATQAKPLTAPGKADVLNDNPMNRGMLAVIQELRTRGIAETTRMSLTWRLMNLGDILRERTRFAAWLIIDEKTGSIEVTEALLRACAQAKISLLGEQTSFDFDDVERLATSIQNKLTTNPVAG